MPNFKKVLVTSTSFSKVDKEPIHLLLLKLIKNQYIYYRKIILKYS